MYMSINENTIMDILNKYDKIVRSTGAFLLEIDDNKLCITDSCEGIELVPLNKETCFKLSEMFKELGESLS